MNLTIFGQMNGHPIRDFFVSLFTYALIQGAIIGTVLCIACVFIMKHKGYDNLVLWGVLGFFGGLIGLIICLTRPNLKNQSANSQPYGQPYGQPYQPPYGEPYQPPYQPEMQQGVRCNSCGMLNPPEALHCIQCGEKLN